MARSTTDIVARLSMNGAQFSAETNKLFGQVEAGARTSAAELTRIATEASRKLEGIAKTAAAAPRMSSGALNIDVAGSRAAAQAAAAEAIALREVATAAERVALTQGQLSERQSAVILGTRQAAAAAETHARAMAEEARFADLLQAELVQTAGATDQVIVKNRALNTATRGSGMAMVQASQQVQDFFVQVGSGQSAMTAFIQQFPQLTYVLQSAGGQTGKLATLLSGPLGIALTLVGAGLVMFGDKLFGTADALAKETRELEKNAEKTRITEQAKAAFERSAPGVIAKIDEETAAWEKQNRTIFENIAARYNQQRQLTRDTQSNLTTTITDLSKKMVELSEAEAEVARARRRAARASAGAGGEAARADLKNAEIAVQQRREEVQKLEQQQRDLERSVTNSRQMERAVEADADETKLTQKMDAERASADKLADTIKELNRAYAAGEISRVERSQRSRQAQTDHDAEIKRVRDLEKARQGSSQTEQRMRLLDPISGGRVTSGFGSRAAPIAGASTNHKGIDIAVPVGTGVRAGGAGVVVSVGNMGRLGKAVIVDYGDKVIATYGHLSEILVGKGDSVAAGQTIARSGNTGNSTGPHLHYGVTKDGRPISPRNVSVREGAGAKAGDDMAREAAEQRKKEAEQYDRIVVASQRQLDVEAESLRFLGLKVRGLDEQAAAEMEIARKQREHSDRMAELTDDQWRVEAKLHPMLTAALGVFRDQADVYADIIEKAGDQNKLTEAQRVALDDANAAMLAQLEAARALAKTAEDRYQIEAAIARVQARLTTAEGKGQDRARVDKQVADERAKHDEEYDRARTERQRDQIYSLADFYRSAFDGGTSSIVERFGDEMKDVISEVAARWTVALLTGQKASLGSILGDMGATSGVGGGGLLGALGLLGGKSKADKFGSSLLPGVSEFGAAKAAAGGGLFGGLGGVGSAISSALPYAAIAMAVLPMMSALFASPKWGSASLSLNGGVVSGAQGVGKGASEIKASTGAAGSVAEGINRLAEQLGANITNIPGVTIGSWDGRARVALTQTNAKLHSKNFGPETLKDFGEGGEQEAIQYAIQYAFTNAALEGISQASKNIIKAGGDDVASAITKALLIEDVPKRLQAMLDPVGYQIDQFNKSWEKTIAALKEGGASAEQMAEAQKLYKLELAETKAAAQEASSDLKTFLKSLNLGGASPYSLRDQERMAYEAFKPFEEAILKGERIDQDKYQESAQQWLDLQRELFGSTGKFFESMDKVQSLTGKAISDIDNAKPIRVETDPWVKATAGSTQASAELLDQLSRQTGDNNALLARIAEALANGGSAFVGGNARGFAAVAAVG